MEQKENKGGGGSSKPSPATNERKAKPMKVKHIVTQTVCTDEAHFKSVVQRLTGKDSVVGETPSEKATGSKAGSTFVGEEGEKRKEEFEDALMGELPSIEELRQWWCD
ncbi:VQ motif-containing protein 1-like [Ananas comosus]|uniref:VQ motif-containing protein 1-like n=1 Tax=Ananas comosus TaxID=4615 RepID=A0A6P5FXC0_ANACO|nr:VQ motif-containing protein 1-like [Ananas comosus]